MATLSLYFEDKPLRPDINNPSRERYLGPPDKYQQEPGQKEDELSPNFLKHGFTNPLLVSAAEECSTVRHTFAGRTAELLEAKIVPSLNKIKLDSQRFKEINDSNVKKKLDINKNAFKCFTLVQPSRRSEFKVFLDDLAGQRPLSAILSDACDQKRKHKGRIPVFQSKKGEMFYLLAECNVPVSRAAWYLKLLAYIQPTITQEQSSKGRSKRATTDPSAEWTQKIIYFLDDMWPKLTDANPPANKTPQGNNPLILCKQPSTRDEIEDYWNYGIDLLAYLYTENMLEKESIIIWIIEHGEKLKSGDEFQLRQLLPIILYYMNDIVRNQLNARRAAYIVAQMLYWIQIEIPEEQAKEKTEVKTEPGTQLARTNGITATGNERRYDTLVWGLNTVIQLITLYCPGALVWYEPSDPRHHPGSPLDLLPQAPSQMLIAPSTAQFFGGEQEFVNQLRLMERQISRRSMAIEVKWSWDKCRDPLTAATITRVLEVINILDTNLFHIKNSESKTDPLRPIYDPIFKPQGSSDGNNNAGALVGTLCDWAVSSKRFGYHRGLLVAKLLALRQDELEQQEPNRKRSIPFFQHELFQYLNDSAPITQNGKDFHNLICLYAELIRHDVFSHTYYVSALISRGEVSTQGGDHGEESRHYIFLRHIPIPSSVTQMVGAKLDEDVDDQKGERNQRAIALYGIGARRKDAKKYRKNLILNLFKSILEPNDEGIFAPSSEQFKRFRNCCYFDKWYVGSQLVKKLHISLKRNSQLEFKMPPIEGIARLIDILLESGNILAILELVSLCIPVFRSLENGCKRKSLDTTQTADIKSMASTAQKTIIQYSRNVGLIFTGILKLCHDYTLLEYDLCQKIFVAYQKVKCRVHTSLFGLASINWVLNQAWSIYPVSDRTTKISKNLTQFRYL